METRAFQDVVRGLGDLPTLPSMAVKVMELAMDPAADLRAFTQLIAQDQSLAAKVLKLANSANFAQVGGVASLQRAVQLLGIRVVRNLALSVLVFDVFHQDRPAGKGATHPCGLDLDELWKHAAAVAFIAEDVAQRLGYAQADEAYIAGLLHDIGKVGLCFAAPDQFQAVIEAVRSRPNAPMIEVESEQLGFTHCQVGRWLAQTWRLPESLERAIWLHHQPAASYRREELLSLPVIVRCANDIAHTHRLGASGNDWVQPLLAQWSDAFGLDAAACETIAARALERMRELLTVLGVKADLSDLYLSLVRQANAEVASYAVLIEGQHRALQARQKVLEAVSSIATAPMQQETLDGLLERMARAVCDALQVPAATLLVRAPDADGVNALCYDPVKDRCRRLFLPAEGSALPEIATLANEGVALSPTEQLLLSDRDLARLAEDLLAGVRTGTLFAVPLVSGGMRLGELLLNAGAIPQTLANELRALADVLALTLERYFAFQSQASQAEELALAAQRVEQAQARLFHHERLAAIGRLAAGAAHEINNPLAIISGNAQLLLRARTDAKRKQFASVIIDQAERITKIINDLLGFARPAKPEMAAVSVPDMVRNVLEMVGHRIATDKIHIETQFARGLPPVHADARQIEQVLLNLIINAVQAMPDGGSLSIWGVPVPGNEYVEIGVRDTGRGIAPEDLPHIFEPFFTTKSSKDGNGLGLAVSRTIVQSHNGSLDVESKLGEGTTFRLRLPVDHSGQVRAMQATLHLVAGEGKTGRGKSILIVEDEEELRRVVSQLLMEEGYEVCEAADGIEGLSMLTTRTFDLVLLDLRMPRMSGTALLGSIAEILPRLPVVVITGMATEEEVEQAIAKGAFAVLRKPFDLAHLLRVAQEAIASRAPQRSVNNTVA